MKVLKKQYSFIYFFMFVFLSSMMTMLNVHASDGNPLHAGGASTSFRRSSETPPADFTRTLPAELTDIPLVQSDMRSVESCTEMDGYFNKKSLESLTSYPAVTTGRAAVLVSHLMQSDPNATIGDHPVHTPSPIKRGNYSKEICEDYFNNRFDHGATPPKK